MQQVFQITEYGHTREENDKIIYDLRKELDVCSNIQNNTVTDLIDIAEVSKNKDRIIQDMKQEKEEMTRMFTKLGHSLEDKDKTIHNLQNTLQNTITDLCDIHAESKDKDSIIHNMKLEQEEMKQMFLNFTDKLTTKDRIIHNMHQKIEDMKQRLDECSQRGYLMNPGFQPPDCNVAVPPRHTLSIQHEECHDIARLQEELQHSKQMIEKLKNEAQTRQQNIDSLEQNLLSLSIELEQIKADQEWNHGRNVSVNNNFYGQTNVLNGSSNNTQIGNRNLMRNVQHSPRESVN